MKIIFGISVISLTLVLNVFSQNSDYWKNAPKEGTLIYEAYSIDDNTIYAISQNDEFFISNNSGQSWKFLNSEYEIDKLANVKNIWSVKIFCIAMTTTDGGNSWLPYLKEQKDHFCKVYLKDSNSGYHIAYEFLSKVISKIIASINSNSINSLVDNPQQCTEYYSNEVEGWVLGWCVKELKIREKY